MAKSLYTPKDLKHPLSLADIDESGSTRKLANTWFGVDEVPLMSTSAAVSANQALFRLYRAPHAGFIRNVSVYIDTGDGSSPGAGHNMELGIWDTGEATAASYTNLATSTSITIAAAGWQTLWDPKLAVVEGQHFMLQVAADGTTVKFGKLADADASSALELNAIQGLTTSGGNKMKLAAARSSVYGVTTAITEANMVVNKVQPVFVFQITGNKESAVS